MTPFEPSTPDEDLVRSFVTGDGSAFNELMKRHEDRIFVMAYRITGDRGDALDATQEAFVSLFRKAHSFRGDSAFGTWFYRIGMNAAYDVVRRRRRTPEPRAEIEAGPEASGATTMEEAMGMRSEIGAALAQLPPDYREAIVMHALGGFSYEEIATTTRVSLGTVKSRISRGRKRLARLLEPSYGTGTSKDQS
ncbi:MAG: sigma-70 family RNA polymerase sigma factor [Actinomycetota bacterium]|nr:sigma-70 family RNA polymerase sigma factor [Actinomycetota bacterium]